jgi:nucleotide-binding universal stress UspA family protein
MAANACVIAATDFSPGADRAVRRAAAVTSLLGGVLHVLHVLPRSELLAQFLPAPSEEQITALRKRADEALQQRVQRVAADFGVTPSWALFHGQAHRAILDAVKILAADIVVAGAQGEHGRSSAGETLGETALKLAQRSAVPVLLVRRKAAAQYGAVVACAKGEPADRAVIRWADELSPDNLLHVVSAYTVPYEERLIEWGASQSTLDGYATRERARRMQLMSDTLCEMRVPAARAQLHVERGMPLQRILHRAAQLPADLVIVGRGAQSELFGRGAIGSVARDIALLAPMDVLIVPPATAATTASGVDAGRNAPPNGSTSKS